MVSIQSYFSELSKRKPIIAIFNRSIFYIRLHFFYYSYSPIYIIAELKCITTFSSGSIPTIFSIQPGDIQRYCCFICLKPYFLSSILLMFIITYFLCSQLSRDVTDNLKDKGSSYQNHFPYEFP